MAVAHYATGGIGPLWPYIPWCDFTGLNLSAGQSINYTCTFPNIGILNMNIYAQSASWTPTTANGWPFATTIYTGVSGNPGVLSIGSGSIIFRNITLTDFNNNPLGKNYHVIVTDSEGTGTQNGGERLTWRTNGGPWFNLGTVPNVSPAQSVITGVGTTTLVSNGSLGTGATFITPVGVTLNPTNIQLDVIAHSRQGTTFGIEIELVNLNKSVSSPYGKVGDILTYTIALTNVSLFNNLTSPILIDTLPNGISYVPNSLKVNGSSYASSTFPSTLTLPDMLAQQVATISYNATILSTVPDSIPNYAYASGIQGPSFNSGVSNLVSTTISQANLSLSKIVDKSFASANSTIAYTVVVKNIGNTATSSITLVDTLPATTSYVSGSLTGGSGAPPNITLTNIPANGVTTVTYIALLSSIPNGTLNNTAYANYSYIYNPLTSQSANGSTISNTVTTDTLKATINNLNKSVSSGYGVLNDTLTYTLNFTNLGNDIATSIIFIDTIPNYTTFLNNSVFINGVNYPGLSIGSTAITIPNTPSLSTTTIVYSVVVTSLPSSNPILNQGTLNYSYAFATVPLTINSNIIPTTILMANLNSSKSVDLSYAKIGDVLTYTIPITNTGNTNAYNIKLIDTLPSSLSLVSNSIYINGVLTLGSLSSPGLTIPTIPSGGLATVTFKVLINTLPTTNPYNNQALINYAYTLNPLTTPNTSFTYTNIAQTSIVSINLNVQKTVDKTFSTPGDILTYTIVIQNLSNIACSNLIFNDTLANGLTFVNNSLTVNGISTSYTPASIPLGSIGINETITISYKTIIS